MSATLDRAKDLQHKVAAETACWIKLDLLEALIAEIERLEEADRIHRAAPLLRGVREAASQRANDQQKGPL